MNNELDYFSFEIYSTILDRMRTIWEFRNNVTDDDIFIYLIMRYIVEYKSQKYKSDLNKYTDKQEKLIEELFLSSSYSLYDYIWKYISEENVFKVHLEDGTFIIEKDNHHFKTFVLHQYKALALKSILYKKENVYLSKYMENVFDDIEMRMEKDEKYRLLDKSRRREYSMYLSLMMLDEIYLMEAPVDNPIMLECRLHYAFVKFFTCKYIKEIKESDIEDYLARHIEIISSDLKVIGRQVKIGKGIIDILCQRSDGSYVIIELKNKTSKSIIWQAMYYPKKFREVWNVLNDVDVLFMPFCPCYEEHISSVLIRIENVLMMEYRLYVEGKTITGMEAVYSN